MFNAPWSSWAHKLWLPNLFKPTEGVRSTDCCLITDALTESKVYKPRIGCGDAPSPKALVFRGCTTIPLYLVCGLGLKHPKEASIRCGNLKYAIPGVTSNRRQHMRFRRSCSFHYGRGPSRLVLNRVGRFENETLWIRVCGNLCYS